MICFSSNIYISSFSDNLLESITFHLDFTCSEDVLKLIIKRFDVKTETNDNTSTVMTLGRTLGEFMKNTGTNIPLLLQRLDGVIDSGKYT